MSNTYMEAYLTLRKKLMSLINFKLMDYTANPGPICP